MGKNWVAKKRVEWKQNFMQLHFHDAESYIQQWSFIYTQYRLGVVSCALLVSLDWTFGMEKNHVDDDGGNDDDDDDDDGWWWL